MKKLISLTIGLIALAMITTMTSATKTQVAEAKLNCRDLDDGTVVCSGGGGAPITGGPGGGGGGRPGSNEELIVNGGHCEIGPGGDPRDCVGEYNRYE